MNHSLDYRRWLAALLALSCIIALGIIMSVEAYGQDATDQSRTLRRLARIEAAVDRNASRPQGSVWCEAARYREGEVIIPIWARGFELGRVTSFSLVVEFDPAALAYNRTAYGAGTLDWGNVAGVVQADGTLLIAGVAFSGAPIEGAACREIAALHFAPAVAGPTVITLRSFGDGFAGFEPEPYVWIYELETE